MISHHLQTYLLKIDRGVSHLIHTRLALLTNFHSLNYDFDTIIIFYHNLIETIQLIRIFQMIPHFRILILEVHLLFMKSFSSTNLELLEVMALRLY